MPVRIEDNDPEIDLRPGTTKSDIVAFLCRTPEWGFSPEEIKEFLDIPRGTTTTVLKHLYDDNYIGKTGDGYYHVLDNRENIQRYVSNLDQVDRMFRHHQDVDTAPEKPVKQIGEGRTDEELDAELAELEDNTGDLDE